MLTEFSSALHALAVRFGAATPVNVEDEHARWEIYRSAIRDASVHSLLASTLALDPDLILVQSVVLAVLEQVSESERQDWVRLVKGDRLRAYVTVRVEELRILESKANDIPVAELDVTTWTDWLQVRLAEIGDNDDVLQALSHHGRTRRIRNIANQRLHSSRPGRG